MTSFAITADPLDAAGISAFAQARHATRAEDIDAEGPGAIVVFVGTVRGRHQGRRVTALTYEAYTPLAIASFERIAREAEDRVPGIALCLHHRIGTLAVGEASIVIATAAAHRADAYGASRFAIERVKQIAPIWKREHFEDGASWVDGAVVDPDDPGPLADAWTRACR